MFLMYYYFVAEKQQKNLSIYLSIYLFIYLFTEGPTQMKTGLA